MTTAAAWEPIEAGVMREYDDNIRLYTPMLQRIIILVAVIVAVPVVLWTITAFVRSYVAPPQIQTFRPLAANPAPAQANTQSANTQSNVQVAAQSASTQTTNVATDARTPLLAIKKPSDAPQAAPMMPSQQTAAATPPAPLNAAAADAAPAPGSTLATRGGVPPPPFAATRATPSTLAAPVLAAPAMTAPTMAAPAPASANVALASNAAGQAATPPAPNAMPMPAASSADSQSADAASSQAQSANDSADDLPASTPLRGKIPDRKSTRLNSSHLARSRMPSSA